MYNNYNNTLLNNLKTTHNLTEINITETAHTQRKCLPSKIRIDKHESQKIEFGKWDRSKK